MSYDTEVRVLSAAKRWREARKNIPESKTPLQDMQKAELDLMEALRELEENEN